MFKKLCNINKCLQKNYVLIDLSRWGGTEAGSCSKAGARRFSLTFVALSFILSISLFRPGCPIFWKFLSHLHYSFRSALPSSCGLQMVRIGKELQDGLLQLVTATICRDYLCIVRQWGDSVTPARRRMLFAKESVLEPIKFLTTCYSLPGNEMWGKNSTAPSFEEPGQFAVKILRGNITFNQYLITVFWEQDNLISNLLLSDTVVILSSSLSGGTWYLQNHQE